MAGTLLPASLTVRAEEPDDKVSEMRTEEAVKRILIDGEEVSLKATITYQTENKEEEQTTDLSYEGYNLKWEDRFEGESLNRDDWNVELHDPGWVNNELQSYVDSPENIYLQDGSLVLKPVENVSEDGSVSYTSGRINTQHKHDFKYGLFEARVKVPEGQGFLPAFWMMPTDENLYGQWPRCGEIDIMEVLGNNTDTSYGTIHYGNPHSESQGSYTLDEGSFSEEYHVFDVEWEPGKISWYVDGKLIHTEDNWYSATEGQGEITYPAPFDQPFYIILNLAVGGNWPGNPDDTTDIKNSAYYIDYVKVYQKDSYDENVTKPIEEVILRDPDENGNYIINGDFSVNEELTDDKDWVFLTALGGEAGAEIRNNEIAVTTENEGTVDYSVQLVQPNLPMKQGGVYRLSFDAYADADRTMKVGISAPDRSFRRYLNDTEISLTQEKQTYNLDFTMTDSDDANGRLEFNMGAAGSTSGIRISNVSLKKTDEIAAAPGKRKRCSEKRCRCRRLTPHDGRMDVALRPPGHQLAPLGMALDVAGNVAALGSYPQPLRANLREHSLRQLCGNALPLEAGWHPRVQQVQRVTPAQVVDDGLLPVAQVERVALPCRVVSKRISFHGVVFVGS